MSQGRGSEATARPFFSARQKKLFVYIIRTRGAGCVQASNIKLVCLLLCAVYYNRVVCTLYVYERCTRPISTNQGSMQAGEYGLRVYNAWDAFRRTPSRGGSRSVGLMQHAVLVVCFECGGISFFFFFFQFERTQPAASCKYEPGLPHLPLYLVLLRHVHGNVVACMGTGGIISYHHHHSFTRASSPPPRRVRTHPAKLAKAASNSTETSGVLSTCRRVRDATHCHPLTSAAAYS